MAAKLSPRLQHLVDEAAALSPQELAVLLEAMERFRTLEDGPGERNDVIAERVRRVQAGEVETLSLAEVEESLRRELDF